MSPKGAKSVLYCDFLMFDEHERSIGEGRGIRKRGDKGGKSIVSLVLGFPHLVIIGRGEGRMGRVQTRRKREKEIIKLPCGMGGRRTKCQQEGVVCPLRERPVNARCV